MGGGISFFSKPSKPAAASSPGSAVVTRVQSQDNNAASSPQNNGGVVSNTPSSNNLRNHYLESNTPLNVQNDFLPRALSGDNLLEEQLAIFTQTSNSFQRSALEFPYESPRPNNNNFEDDDNNNHHHRINDDEQNMISIPYTPTGEEAEIYKYYCPLCMLYFKYILKSGCCGNYTCFTCIKDFLKTKGIPNCRCVEDFDRHQNKLDDIHCPHCFTKGFHPIRVSHREVVRDYSMNTHPSSSYAIQPSPLKIGESFEDMKRKMIPFKVLMKSTPNTNTHPQSLSTNNTSGSSKSNNFGIDDGGVNNNNNSSINHHHHFPHHHHNNNTASSRGVGIAIADFRSSSSRLEQFQLTEIENIENNTRRTNNYDELYDHNYNDNEEDDNYDNENDLLAVSYNDLDSPINNHNISPSTSDHHRNSSNNNNNNNQSHDHDEHITRILQSNQFLETPRVPINQLLQSTSNNNNNNNNEIEESKYSEKQQQYREESSSRRNSHPPLSPEICDDILYDSDPTTGNPLEETVNEESASFVFAFESVNSTYTRDCAQELVRTMLRQAVYHRRETTNNTTTTTTTTSTTVAVATTSSSTSIAV